MQDDLLSADDMAGLVELLGPVPEVSGGWLLDGNLHPDVYEVFKRESFLLFAQLFSELAVARPTWCWCNRQGIGSIASLCSFWGQTCVPG